MAEAEPSLVALSLARSAIMRALADEEPGREASLPPTAPPADSRPEADSAPPFEIVLPRQDGGCAGGMCSRGDEPELRYRPLYPELFGRRFKREWLADSFASAFEERSAAAVKVAMRGVLRTCLLYTSPSPRDS